MSRWGVWLAVALVSLPSNQASAAGLPAGRSGMGTFVASADSPHLLLSRRQGDGPKSWRRVAPRARVRVAENLLSLPGGASRVRLDSGVELILRGLVPHFGRTPEMKLLVESAVTLHQPSKGRDADLTYLRGRIYLSNHKRKGAAQVRLHFEGQTWDLVLEAPGAEVAIDLLKSYTRDIDFKAGEGPRADLYLAVLNGKVKLQPKAVVAPLSLEAPPGPTFLMWNNKGPGLEGPFSLPRVPPVWDKNPPTPTDPDLAKENQRMTQALFDLGSRLVGKPVEAAVWEGHKGDRESRQLGIYALGAIDSVPKLLDVLGDANPAHAVDRYAAIFTLRRWLGRGAEQGKRLYDPTTETGLLLESRRYNGKEARILLDLLHDFPEVERSSRKTFELLARNLCHRKVGIAQLSFWQLQRLAKDVELPPFNAAAPLGEREKTATKVTDLVRAGKLPPPAPKPDPSP